MRERGTHEKNVFFGVVEIKNDGMSWRKNWGISLKHYYEMKISL